MGSTPFYFSNIAICVFFILSTSASASFPSETSTHIVVLIDYPGVNAPFGKYIKQRFALRSNYDGTSEGKSAGGTKDDFGDDDDESKWAITVAGGIPPLV